MKHFPNTQVIIYANGRLRSMSTSRSNSVCAAVRFYQIRQKCSKSKNFDENSILRYVCIYIVHTYFNGYNDMVFKSHTIHFDSNQQQNVQGVYKQIIIFIRPMSKYAMQCPHMTCFSNKLVSLLDS